jgi:ankyrin repeat protein
LILSLIFFSVGCSNPEFAAPSEARVNALDFESRLLLAVRSGDIESLEKSLAENPDLLSGVSSAGHTLLHHAVMVSQEASVRFLLEQGADPNALNTDNDTPMDLAREVGADRAVAEILRSAGGV